ncbi:hypothetical protein BCR34DRAFT_575001 [Clohesyomyces aquaticus]|uniref:Uncharacterized protein n=1 Tax=Clohesyomyces aquaticus TaxID=1231657 RepID=A0A1Y1YTD5_9PLEO|nr:hypothetical protein BCR34DRAFT_575001 [Clohesyomyces aquaticus]
MPPRSPAHLRTLLRSSTLLTPAAAQLTFGTLSLSQLQRRSRSPSPSEPLPLYTQSVFHSQNRHLSISTTHRGAQWTRFATPYSLSSMRTFSSAGVKWRPNEEAGTATIDSGTARRIEEVVEEITELYGTARDEFEIAAEETEKNTTYAPDDRAAAREELDKLLEYYKGIVEGEDRAVAEEVKRRVGGKVRELESAIKTMEEAAMAGD